jgi:hypothetical protein
MTITIQIEDQPHYLYRHFDMEGSLLYIGVTRHPLRRTAARERHSPWWVMVADVTFISFPTRSAARAAETAAIVADRPPHNLVSTGKADRHKAELARARVYGTVTVPLGPALKALVRYRAAQQGSTEGGFVLDIIKQWKERRDAGQTDYDWLYGPSKHFDDGVGHPEPWGD